jgi:hypothetical protein
VARPHPKNLWLSRTIPFGGCTLLAEINPLLVGVCTLLAELEHFSSAVEKLIRHCPGTEYQHKRGHASNIVQNTEKFPLSALQ